MENNADKIKGMREDFKKTFETEEGKKVLRHLASHCLYGVSIFDKDSHVMAYQAGLRDVYLSIINIMGLDIEQLERIIKGTQDAV